MTEEQWLACADPAAMIEVASGHRVKSGPGWEPHRPISDRKLRLFACAWWRSIPMHTRAAEVITQTVECGEVATDEESGEEIDADWLLQECLRIADQTGRSDPVGPRGAALLRDVVGSPHRPAKPLAWWEPPECHVCGNEPDDEGEIEHGRGSYVDNEDGGGSTFAEKRSVAWLTPTVLSLAAAAYEDRPGRECEKCEGVGQRHQTQVISGARVWMVCPDCRGAGRTDDGTLDPLRLAILADALEEAGCDDEAILRHLRGQERCPTCGGVGTRPQTVRDISRLPKYKTRQVDQKCPGVCLPKPQVCQGGWLRSAGPHVRGCWVLDLILGKE